MQVVERGADTTVPAVRLATEAITVITTATGRALVVAETTIIAGRAVITIGMGHIILIHTTTTTITTTANVLVSTIVPMTTVALV